MTKRNSGTNAFRELETQNPFVAEAFAKLLRREHYETASAPATTFDYADYFDAFTGIKRMHRHASGAVPSRSAGCSPVVGGGVILLVVGVIVVAGVILAAGAGKVAGVGSTVVHFLMIHGQAILLPIGGICAGAGAVLLARRVGNSPLRSVAPPDADSKDPLQELKYLAERTASRLRAAYRLQLGAVMTVGAMFIALIVWSMVMVSQERLLYASAFGSGSVAMVILTQWKWQPFDRINDARRLADNADTLATGLRLRMNTISEVVDPSERAKAQWDAVKEYLERS